MVIHRSRERVFAFLSDLENRSRWHPALGEGKSTSPDSTGVDSTFRQEIVVSGRPIQLAGRITEYEPDKRLSFDYSGEGLACSLTFDLEPVEVGTNLTVKGEGKLDGFFSLFEPVVGHEVNAHLSTHLQDLKDLLESQEFLEEA